MLLEIAVGDAYGAGFEYVDAGAVAAGNDLSRYRQHPRHRGIWPGRYTDDTQMSVAVAEAVLSDEPWTPRLLAERFVRAYRRDPREGYASGFRGVLQVCRTGEELLRAVRGGSQKSGAAMRATLCGAFPDAQEVERRCRIQAEVTHGGAAVDAAVVAALMAYHGLYRVGPRVELRAFVSRLVPGNWSPWRGKVGSEGTSAVRAALTAVSDCDSLSSTLRACVAFTGDVDTVAAIAMGAASARDDVEADLPECLVSSLECGRYGRPFLEELDRHLLARVRRFT